MAESFIIRKKLSLLNDRCTLYKVREENRVLSKSCHIAIGITKDGDREIIGFMIQSGESEETWTTFFEYLKERGLQGTELVISDAHKGLVSAIRKSFTNVSWQRCQVHFLKKYLYHHS